MLSTSAWTIDDWNASDDELLLLLGVGDEAHLDEHRRHVGADEHAERRLLNRARAHRHALAQRALDRLRQHRGLLDVAGLRHLPEDDFDVARAAAEDRQRFAFAPGDALRLVAVLVEAQVEDLGACRRAAHRRVGVQADEQVRLVVVGERRALVEADRLIAVARQDDAHAQPRLERRLQPARHAQRHVLFERAARSARAVFVAAVAGVDDDRAHAARRREVEQRRRQSGDGVGGAGAACRRAGVAGAVGRLRDDVDDDAGRRRDRPAGPRCGTSRSAARDRSTMDGGAVAGANALNEVGRRRGWQRGVECVGLEAGRRSRLPSCAIVCGVGGATSSVSRASAPCGSTSPATRGTRRSPTMTSRDGLRSSSRVPSDGASARGDEVDRHEPGRARRVRARAGSEIEPAADRGKALTRRQHDRLARAVTVRPPARRLL